MLSVSKKMKWYRYSEYFLQNKREVDRFAFDYTLTIFSK